jgi:hypothetical protein
MFRGVVTLIMIPKYYYYFFNANLDKLQYLRMQIIKKLLKFNATICSITNELKIGRGGQNKQ